MALQTAAETGDAAVTALLLDVGADINARPSAEDSRTAIQAAAERGQSKVAQMLISAGADTDTNFLSCQRTNLSSSCR
jgi:ankyrin repeat protein